MIELVKIQVTSKPALSRHDHTTSLFCLSFQIGMAAAAHTSSVPKGCCLSLFRPVIVTSSHLMIQLQGHLRLDSFVFQRRHASLPLPFTTDGTIDDVPGSMPTANSLDYESSLV